MKKLLSITIIFLMMILTPMAVFASNEDNVNSKTKNVVVHYWLNGSKVQEKMTVQEPISIRVKSPAELGYTTPEGYVADGFVWVNKKTGDEYAPGHVTFRKNPATLNLVAKWVKAAVEEPVVEPGQDFPEVLDEEEETTEEPKTEEPVVEPKEEETTEEPKTEEPVVEPKEEETTEAPKTEEPVVEPKTEVNDPAEKKEPVPTPEVFAGDEEIVEKDKNTGIGSFDILLPEEDKENTEDGMGGDIFEPETQTEIENDFVVADNTSSDDSDNDADDDAKGPNTGDAQSLVMWFVTMILAGLGIGRKLVLDRRK